MTTTPGPRTAHIEELRRLMADPNVVRFTPDADYEIRLLLEARADVDGLVAQLQKAAQLVIGYGVGNLTGPKYHARVAALDVLGDALEALLAGDKAEAPRWNVIEATWDKAEAPE